jgi:hypothetical protein|tara:strand:+ start:256 stop:420 length:165 start_codon:yes stop_codon:yes gene_type:complete
MEQTEKLFNALVSGDSDEIQSSFATAVGEKMQQAYDIRKVRITSDVFNKQKEAK